MFVCLFARFTCLVCCTIFACVALCCEMLLFVVFIDCSRAYVYVDYDDDRNGDVHEKLAVST